MMDAGVPARGRMIVAAAVLATLGLGCVGAVLVFLTLLGLALGDHAPAGGDRGIADVLGALALVARAVPAVAWAMVAAAVGLHAGSRAGRALALGVSLVLAASVPALLLAGQRPWPDPVAGLMYHAFVIASPGSVLAVADVGLASLVAWAAITGTSSPAGAPDGYRGMRSAPRPRSVTYLAASLALVGIYALAPLVVMLVAIVAPGEGNLGNLSPARDALLVVSCVSIAGLALGAALALATGRRLGLLVSLPAAAIGGAWGGLWAIALFGSLVSALGDDVAYAAGTPLMLAAIGGVAGFSVLALVVSVRTRTWFEPVVAGNVVRPRARTGAGRPKAWILGTVLAEVVAVAVVVSVPAEEGSVALRAPGELPGAILFRGRDYEEMAWADLMASDLERIDGVDLFDEDSVIAPPVGYRLQDVPPDALIVLEPGDVVSEATSRHVALFTPAGDATEFVDLPAAVCPLVDLTTAMRGQCAAPERMVWEDRWYQRDLALLVPSNHLAAASGSARFDPPAAAYVPTRIQLIDGVDPSVAIAIAAPTGGIVYRALAFVDAPVSELCNYVRDEGDGAPGCQ